MMKSEVRSLPLQAVSRGQKSGFDKGFSLVELLIVCAMMGLVMAAIFTLYQTHQRIAYTQEEVVEVQQNLRIAMDSIARDLRMAGFLMPSGTNPLDSATANTLTINTASENVVYARLTADVTTAASSTTTFTVESSEVVDGFDSGASGSIVRIIRPADKSQPMSNETFRVSSKDRTAKTLTLVRTSGASFSAGVVFKKGDIIVKTAASTPDTYPNTIVYSVGGSSCPSGQNCIARNANGGGDDIVANNIAAAGAGLQFSYILDDNTETAAPADLSKIRSVRVIITGQTVATTALSGGQAKQREIVSIVRIRNR